MDQLFGIFNFSASMADMNTFSTFLRNSPLSIRIICFYELQSDNNSNILYEIMKKTIIKNLLLLSHR